MGPVASVVVARSECPVLTVPTHHAPWSNESGLYGRIVCAVDLAPSSLSVIHQALSLAWETAGHVTYVCVLPEGVSKRSAAARDRLLEAIPSEASGWCETEVLVSRGAPGTEIVRIAEEQKADLVVIGAPRRWTSTTHAGTQSLALPRARHARRSALAATDNQSRARYGSHRGVISRCTRHGHTKRASRPGGDRRIPRRPGRHSDHDALSVAGPNARPGDQCAKNRVGVWEVDSVDGTGSRRREGGRECTANAFAPLAERRNRSPRQNARGGNPW